MIVLIDNYDSFTYNLYHYLGEMGATIQVFRNDAITVDELFAMKPKGIVLSPGPCTPNEAGICIDVIKHADQKSLPLLGVCLGHQAIGQSFGGKIIRAPLPVHGKTDLITHQNIGLFKDIHSPVQVTRYHSLIVERTTLPDMLTITAENEQGLIMAMQHKTKPIFGVQFHPESIASEHGKDMLKNFLNTTV
jgi:anthranilate synthase component 2